VVRSEPVFRDPPEGAETNTGPAEALTMVNVPIEAGVMIPELLPPAMS
jgi:hypothetical protein